MKILVTGSSSYIGQVLLPILVKKDHHVFIVDKELGHDICDEPEMEQAIDDVDAIIHLAAASTPKFCEEHPDVAQRVNVEAVKLINRLRGNKPLIFPNTNIGYGAKTKLEIYDETSPMEPQSVYGKTKCEGERLILEHGHCVVFRLASLFGPSPSMRWNLLLNFMVREAFDNGLLKIYEGHVRRNFLHVRDICRAFIHALDNYQNMNGQVYNAGLNHHPTKFEMADMIRDRIPNLKIEEIDGADPDKRDYTISNDKIMATGWKPVFSVQAGIQELVACLKS